MSLESSLQYTSIPGSVSVTVLSSAEEKVEEYLFLTCVVGLLVPRQLGALLSLLSVAGVQLLFGQAGI